MSRWFRFYDEALNDPKILRLPDDVYRSWTLLLCIASKHDGDIPAVDDVAIMLRMTVSETQKIIDDLVSRELLDRSRGGKLTPHNWRKRQYKSDVSTPRVKRFRKRFKAVAETPPETEQRQNRTEQKGADEVVSCETSTHGPVESPQEESGKYVFESGVIRLKEKAFNDWLKAFSFIDLRAELIQLTPWAAQFGAKWFFPVASALAKKNREQQIQLERARATGRGYEPAIPGII